MPDNILTSFHLGGHHKLIAKCKKYTSGYLFLVVLFFISKKGDYHQAKYQECNETKPDINLPR
jgi:uncharacterized membrane protein